MDRSTKLFIAVLLSWFLLVLGTAGYMLMEGWDLLDALYMTVITLTTVGYGEVHEVSRAGRIFTVVLIFLGVGFFVYVVGSVTQFLVEGQMRVILGRRKLENQIKRLKDHYIVCGYGRIGRVLSQHLVRGKLDVVVIEQNRDRIPVMDEDGIPYIIGEATDEDNLLKAGVERAKVLTTALATDADNVFLALSARQINPGIHVVARASQNSAKKTLYAAGVNVVVSPYDIGARRMAHSILRPTVIHFLELAFTDEDTDIHIEEIPVDADSHLVGKNLQASAIRQQLNLIIISMRKSDGAMLFNPRAETTIDAGDTVIAVGKNAMLMKLEKLLNPGKPD
ncbi:MAG: potassium channel protein [Deltaproteobacteria bacterium]|nr:potassium channel protein [Deltaproteobacteria bacterium]